MISCLNPGERRHSGCRLHRAAVGLRQPEKSSEIIKGRCDLDPVVVLGLLSAVGT
jgi:hypothetical protein